MRKPGAIAPYVITFLLGTTLAGGVSAVAATTSSTVKVCANTHGFVVAAKAKKCPKGSHAVSIAKRGPKGSSGAKGTPGKDGTNGYSIAYSGVDTGSSSTNLTATPMVINRVEDLPAGGYVGNYQTNVYNDSTAGSVQCHFAPGSNVNANLSEDADIDVPPGGALSLNGTNAFTLSQPGEVDVVCRASTGPELRILNADVDLTLVNAIVGPS